MRRVLLAAVVALFATLSVNAFATQNVPFTQEIVLEYENLEDDPKLVDQIFAYLCENRGYDLNTLKARLAEGALTIHECNGTYTVTIQQAAGGVLIETAEDLY